MLRIILKTLPVALVASMSLMPLPLLADSGGKDKQVHIYRYKDADGSVLVGRQIPPENYKYGYTALDEYGDVIEVVPPEPTPEERAAFEEEMRRKQQEDERKAKDDMLLKTYGSVKDAINARDRKMAQIDVMVEIIRGKVVVLRANHDRAVKLAADLERDGQVVNQKLLGEMLNLERDIEGLKLEEKDKLAEKDAIRRDFEPLIERMQAIEDVNKVVVPVGDPVISSDADQ